MGIIIDLWVYYLMVFMMVYIISLRCQLSHMFPEPDFTWDFSYHWCSEWYVPKWKYGFVTIEYVDVICMLWIPLNNDSFLLPLPKL